MTLNNNYHKLKELFGVRHSFLLTTHINPDGDGLGAALALARELRGRGKHVDIIISDPIPSRLAFLPEISRVMTYDESRDTKTYDVMLIIDTNTLERIGRVRSLAGRCKLTAILDHHQPGTLNGDGQPDPEISLTVVDHRAASAAEIVWEFLQFAGWPIDKLTALLLYTGFVVDTGNFTQDNTSARCHQAAGELLAAGVSPFLIYQKIYESHSTASLRLAGRMLERMLLTADGLCLYSSITLADMTELRAGNDDTEDLINYLRQHKQAQIIILFRELDGRRTKINFRSKGGIDILSVAQTYGGGGHQAACGATVNLPLAEAISRVITDLGAFAERYIKGGTLH